MPNNNQERKRKLNREENTERRERESRGHKM